jgi:hypothetical protein
VARIEHAEKFLANMGATIKHGGGFRLLGKRVEGVFQLRNQILDHSIGDITDEKIAPLCLTGISCSLLFGVSVTIWPYFGGSMTMSRDSGDT